MGRAVISRVLPCRGPRQGEGVFSLIESQSATDLIVARPQKLLSRLSRCAKPGPAPRLQLSTTVTSIGSCRTRRTSRNKKSRPFFLEQTPQGSTCYVSSGPAFENGKVLSTMAYGHRIVGPDQRPAVYPPPRGEAGSAVRVNDATFRALAENC